MESKLKRSIENVPNDVIFEILRRLPAKPLLRFSCVCKSWHSFASELQYDDHMLILSSFDSIQSVDLEASEIKAVQLNCPLNSPQGFKVIGSCNGLLCISIKKQGFLLWNPWTGRYKKVQESSPLNHFNDQIGFGYDHSTDDYKIVRFLFNEKRKLLLGKQVEIYSLNIDSWKKGCLPWNILSIVKSQSGTFVNGALHWQITYVENFESTEDGPAFKEFLYGILRYDLKSHLFCTIQSPEGKTNNTEFDIGAFRGRLSAVYYNHDDGHIDIWEKEDGENRNWIKLMTIPRPEELLFDMYLAPVCIMKSGEVLMKIKRRKNRFGEEFELERDFKGKKFRLSSPDEKTLKKFKIQDIQICIREIAYTRSLISPIRYGGEER